MMIICDFDGTITERDVTDRLWDGFVPTAVLQRMVAEVTTGHWSMHEYIAHGCSYVREAPAAVLALQHGGVLIRRGFLGFVRELHYRGDIFHVVSNGLDLYVRELLPKCVPCSCFVARYDGAYCVALPTGVEPGEDWKAHRVRELLSGPDRKGPSVYIGDGHADFEAARLCDRIFAVKGSRLSELCRSAQLKYDEFDGFAELRHTLYHSSSF